tara:strand:+ start:1456 stop:6156 length:4701 start_codon:yes stop_codon:yes gene_type:complete
MPKELLEVKNFQTGTISTVSTTDISVDAASMSLNIDPSSEDGVLKGIPSDELLKNNSVHYSGENVSLVTVDALTNTEIREDNPKEGFSYLRVTSNGFDSSPVYATFNVPLSNSSDDLFYSYIRLNTANYNLLSTFTITFTDSSSHTATLTFNDKTLLKPGLWSELSFKYSKLQSGSSGKTILDTDSNNYIYTESNAAFSTLSISSIKFELTFGVPSSDSNISSDSFYFDIDNIKTKGGNISFKADVMKRISHGNVSAIVGYDSDLNSNDKSTISIIKDPEENPSLDSTSHEMTSSANEVNIIENSSKAHIGSGMSSTDKTKWAGIINYPSFSKPQQNSQFEFEDAELKSTTSVYEENNEGDEYDALIKVVTLNKKNGSGATLDHTDTTHPDDYVYGISSSGIHIYRISMGLEANASTGTHGNNGPQEQIDLNGDSSIHSTAGVFNRGSFDVEGKKIVSIAPSRSKIDTLLVLAVDTIDNRVATLYEVNLNIDNASWDTISPQSSWSLDFNGTADYDWKISNRLIPTDIIETNSSTGSKIWVLWTPDGTSQDNMMRYYDVEETESECADRCLYAGDLPTTSGGTIYLDDKSPSFGLAGANAYTHGYGSFPWGDVRANGIGGYQATTYQYCKEEKDFDGSSNKGYTGHSYTKEAVTTEFSSYNNSSPVFTINMQGGFFNSYTNAGYEISHDGDLPIFKLPKLAPVKFSLIDMSANYKSGAEGMPISEVNHVVGFYCKVHKSNLAPYADSTVGWCEKHYGTSGSIYEGVDTGINQGDIRMRYINLEDHNVLWVQSFEHNRGIYQRFPLYGNGHHTGLESDSNKDGIWSETHTTTDEIPTGCLNFPSPNSTVNNKALKLLFVNTEHNNGIANGGNIYSVTKDPDDSRVIITYEKDGIPYIYTHSIAQQTTNESNNGTVSISSANSKELRFINGHHNDSLDTYNNGNYPAKTAQSVSDRVINKKITTLKLDGLDSSGNTINAQRPVFTLRNIDQPTPSASAQFEWYIGALFAGTGILSIYQVDLYKRVYHTFADDYAMGITDLDCVGLHLTPTADEYHEQLPHETVTMTPVLVSTSESSTSISPNLATLGSSSSEGFFDSTTDYKYKVSFIYDGYQESPLSIVSLDWNASMNSESDGQNYGNDSLKISIALRDIPKRVTHLNVYRKDGLGEYRIVRSIGEADSEYSFDSEKDLHIFEFEDLGDSQESYESRTGISETNIKSMVNYALSAELNNQLFVAKCYIVETNFSAPTYMFKSKVGNYNQFDWTNDFLILPTIPTSMASFQGRIYVWDDNNTYKINPSTLSVEDIYEGIGCVGPEAISVTDYGMCFASRNNVYLHNGTQVQPIGDPILRSSKNPSWSHSYQSAVEQTINNGDDINVAFYPKRNCFLIFLSDYIATPDEYGNVPGVVGRVWSYDVARKRWDRWDCPKVNSVVTSKYGEILLSGVPDTSNPDEYKIINYLKDEDNRRTWSWNSKDFVLGQATQDKIFRRIKVEGTSINENINTGTNGTVSSNDDIRILIDGVLSPLTKREDGSWNLDTDIKKGKKCSVAFSNQTGELDSFGLIFRRRGAK